MNPDPSPSLNPNRNNLNNLLGTINLIIDTTFGSGVSLVSVTQCVSVFQVILELSNEYNRLRVRFLYTQ